MYRLAIFKQNLELINNFNAKEAKKEGFTMGTNQFMDLPQEEFRKMYLTYVPPKPEDN